MLRNTAAAALALLLAMPAEAQDADTVIATVNGTEITLGELIVARQRLPQQFAQLPDDQLLDGLVEQLIQQQLLADELEADPKRLELALMNEARSLRAGEVVTKVTEEAVTEEAIQAAYEAATAELEPVTEWNASHILVETEEEAQAIKEEIEGGADFAETAQAKSTGPSGPNGGELGWFGPGQMVTPFEEAVQTLEPGGLSDPVQTQFGWHIVTLNDQRERPIPTIDELRPQLVGQVQQEAFQATIDGLIEAAEIERSVPEGLNPGVLSDLSIIAGD